jgi:hypothetical protein
MDMTSRQISVIGLTERSIGAKSYFYARQMPDMR